MFSELKSQDLSPKLISAEVKVKTKKV